MKDIQIFVSSTFGDMHRERDLLHQVAGVINRDLADSGYRIILHDLRHGVNTAGVKDEREVEKKVLKACFDAIKKCSIFVLLLGDRYGTVFEDLTVPRHYMPNQELKGKSVTHLEVEYGMRNIEKKHILVFDRRFQGDLSEVPVQYRESSAGMQKNRQLKEDLCREGYLVSDYPAAMKDGLFWIMEDAFLKHAQGYIIEMIRDYLDHLEPDSDEGESADEDLYFAAPDEELLREVEKKVTCYPEPFRDASKELILLRVRNLLHQDDFDMIRKIGNNGQAILEYRRRVIGELPDDFSGLLQIVCKCIAGVTDSGQDVFESLQILACAQETALAHLGGISIHELEQILGSQAFPVDQTYGEWLDSRYECGGIFRKQSPLQRGLAYFFENDILLTHSDDGYLLKDCNIASYLANIAPDSIKDRIWEYIAAVFWYLPYPAYAWDELLRTGRFQLCLSCLKYVRFDHRFVDELSDYVAEQNCTEAIIGRLEKFLSWMVEHSAEEAYILFVLKICYSLSLDSDEIFQTIMVPLYQRIHDQIYEKNRGTLSVAQQYLLRYLYDLYEVEIQDPPAPVLTPQQIEEIEILEDAVFELFISDVYGDEEEYANMVSVLRGSMDQFIGILQMDLVRNRSWSALDNKIARMVLREGVLSKEAGLQIMTEVLRFHLDGDNIWNAINNAQESLILPSHEAGEDAFCVSMLHILYDAICEETRLRRCEWERWTTYLFSELINEIYSATKDDVVGNIADMLPGVIEVELTEIDEAYQNLVNRERSEYRRLHT